MSYLSSRPNSSGGRPRSAGGSRRTSDNVDFSESQDSGRSSVSSVANVGGVVKVRADRLEIIIKNMTNKKVVGASFEPGHGS